MCSFSLIIFYNSFLSGNQHPCISILHFPSPDILIPIECFFSCNITIQISSIFDNEGEKCWLFSVYFNLSEKVVVIRDIVADVNAFEITDELVELYCEYAILLVLFLEY